MKVLMALLLVLLLCRQPGRGQAQDSQHGDEGLRLEDEEDDEDEKEEEEEEYEEDEEAGMMGDTGPQCYSCQNLHRKELCKKTQSCPLSQSFCKTLITQGETESGPLTSYSVWCADTCESFNKIVSGTLMTMTCCQTSLCNIPPWQGQPGSAAGGPQGSSETVVMALLLSLLPSLRAMGC